MNTSLRNIVLMAMALYGAYYFYQESQIRKLSSLSANTCQDRQFCVVVYFAPWCPHCKSAVPHTQAMMSKSRTGNVGVRVVIGMERKEGDNLVMANRIGKNAVIDHDFTIAKKLKVSGIPAYRVLDKDGTLILSEEEAYQWVMEKFGS